MLIQQGLRLTLNSMWCLVLVRLKTLIRSAIIFFSEPALFNSGWHPSTFMSDSSLFYSSDCCESQLIQWTPLWFCQCIRDCLNDLQMHIITSFLYSPCGHKPTLKGLFWNQLALLVKTQKAQNSLRSASSEKMLDIALRIECKLPSGGLKYSTTR